ncbi:MAG: hypothetical protein CMH57_14090 [Myxococcales bacterium]|nr:hypothetical protein [Myxococcales bacterium]
MHTTRPLLAATALVALTACFGGSINVEEGCEDACDTSQYCLAHIQHGEFLSTFCHPIPEACQAASDVCECVRTSEPEISHYRCSRSSEEHVVLFAP